MPEFENAIEIRNLTKRYDGFTLDNVSFSLPRGCIMGFIGQNGAGKTTTIRALLNIIKTDGGSITMLGLDHIKDEYVVKEQIAAIFDELPFHESFNANQVNRMFQGLYRSWDPERFFAYLDRFQLPRKKKIAKFSKGMKMKLQIAAALSHGAKLLIMDEATTGLDPVVRNEILDIFREYIQQEDHSILMSSHITSDLEKIADCVTFIDRGKILLTGFRDELLERHAIMKCTLVELEEMPPEAYVSARKHDFGADVMVADVSDGKRSYPERIFDRTTLEELMLFYVNREKKVWQ